MSLYEHVRSPLETRRKMLEMNMKTAELKRAFSEYFLAKNGDAYVSMQLMDSVWSVVEKVMEVAAKTAIFWKATRKFSRSALLVWNASRPLYRKRTSKNGRKFFFGYVVEPCGASFESGGWQPGKTGILSRRKKGNRK